MFQLPWLMLNCRGGLYFLKYRSAIPNGCKMALCFPNVLFYIVLVCWLSISVLGVKELGLQAPDLSYSWFASHVNYTWEPLERRWGIRIAKICSRSHPGNLEINLVIKHETSYGIFNHCGGSCKTGAVQFILKAAGWRGFKKWPTT